LSPKISDQPSPIANLEDPFALSLSIPYIKPQLTMTVDLRGIDKDDAKGCSKLAIGDG
jgi:hypothetical protein